MNARLFTISAIAVFSIAVSVRAQAESLSIRLEQEKSRYVLGEPVKLKVTLQNDSTETIRIVSISRLGMNMEHMFYLLTVPTGDKYQCMSRVFQVERMVDPGYGGEPLAPGEQVVTFLYPTTVWRRPAAATHGPWSSFEEMFKVPGDYRLRVVYGVSPSLPRLLQTGTAGILSDELVLDFRAPDNVERQILESCVPGDDIGANLGELNAHAKFDEAALRAVIREYPDHPMTEYARFSLARSLTRLDRNGIGVDGREGVAIFEDLQNRLPDFRSEEIAKHLGTSYFFLGQRDEAIAVFEDAMAKYPYMRQQYSFMTRYIHALTGDSHAPERWNKARQNGKRNLEFLEE